MSLGFISSETLENELRNDSFIISSEFLAEPPRAQITDDEEAIKLFDLDDNMVRRFNEFLQGGDYSIPASEEELEGEDEDEDEGEEGGLGVMTPDTVQSLADREDLRARDVEWLRARDGNVLRAHAKMYAVAQYKGVDTLRTMALERLRTALGDIDGPKLNEVEGVMVNIIGLFDYVYSHTDSGPGDQMRDLVSTFAAENLESLTGRRGMEFLLAKEGDFAVELVGKVAERLCVMGQEVQKWKDQATTSDRRVRELKLINAEKHQELEVINKEVRGLAATNTSLKTIPNLEGETQDMKRLPEDKSEDNSPLCSLFLFITAIALFSFITNLTH